jgi:hypothetical protein
MSFMASTFLGPLLFDSDRMLHLVPALTNPITALAHGVTSAYLPALARMYLQAKMEPRIGYDLADPRAQVGVLFVGGLDSSLTSVRSFVARFV